MRHKYADSSSKYNTTSSSSSYNINIMLTGSLNTMRRKSTSMLINDTSDLEMRFKKLFEIYDKECAFINYFKNKNSTDNSYEDSDDEYYPNPYNIAAAPSPKILMKQLINSLIINKRDLLKPLSSGENKGRYPIHFLLLANHIVGKKMCKKLIDLYGKEVYRLCYGKGLYEGESLLHMAIAQNDFHIVKYLLQKDILDAHIAANRTSNDLNASKENDTFFGDDHLSSTSVKGKFFKKRKDGGKIYIGKTPMHFAVALGHLEIVKILLNMYEFKGKRLLLDIDGEYGTNVFHFLVKSGSTQLFDLLVSQMDKKDIMHLLHRNDEDGINPLLLAVKIGTDKILECILKYLVSFKHSAWTWGPVSSMTFKVNEIDPLVMINNTINTGSTLHKFAIIPLLLQHKRIEMFNINNGIVALLFKRKWEFYGERKFYFELFFETMYLLTFVIGLIRHSYFYGNRNDSSSNNSNTIINPQNICFIIQSVGLVLKLYSEFAHFVWSSAYTRLSIFSGSSFIGLTCAFLHIFLSISAFILSIFSTFHDIVNVLYALSTLLLMIDFLCLIIVTEFLGHYVIMLWRMLASDMMRTFSIYILVTSFFTIALYPLERNFVSGTSALGIIANTTAASNNATYNDDGLSFNNTTNLHIINNDKNGRYFQKATLLFRHGLDVIFAFEKVISSSSNKTKGDQISTTTLTEETKYFGIFIVLSYIVFAVILLTNVLIASMSDTYKNIIESKRKQWLYARAQYIYKLDISMFASHRRNILDESNYMTLLKKNNEKKEVSYIFHHVNLNNNALED